MVGQPTTFWRSETFGEQTDRQQSGRRELFSIELASWQMHSGTPHGRALHPQSARLKLCTETMLVRAQVQLRLQNSRAFRSSVFPEFCEQLDRASMSCCWLASLLLAAVRERRCCQWLSLFILTAERALAAVGRMLEVWDRSEDAFSVAAARTGAAREMSLHSSRILTAWTR